jgi:toxin-antitoxin system PIN domain toxin
MKLVDANVLLFAVNADAREHARAKAWMETALSGVEPIAFGWVALLAFLRVATRAGLFAKPLKLAKAFDLLEAWIGTRSTHILHPGANHLAILRRLLGKSGISGNLTTDAHLAALAIEHGAELVSFDRDFARFEGLRTIILAA